MKKIFLGFLIVLFVACSGPKDIPNEDMVNIITEALLTGSLTSSEFGVPTPASPGDTIDYYSEILAHYGYDLADFQYTVYNMSMRKSNPLNEIFLQVTKGIDSMALMADYRYGTSLRFDSLALKFYSDTLYSKDTTIHGTINKLKLRFLNVERGLYNISFDYKSVSDYRAGTKSIAYRTGDKGRKSNLSSNRIWINRSVDTTHFDSRIELIEAHDTLFVNFEDPVLDRANRVKFYDSSFVSNVKLIFTPEVTRARKNYYNRYFKDIKLYQIIKNEEDSLSVRAKRKWSPAGIASR
ncbi:MAG: hypothetical protein RR499_00670 [Mucinivorans sp.]